MSPTIMRELGDIRRFIRAGYDKENGWYSAMAWNYPGASNDDLEVRIIKSNAIIRDPSRLFKLELPERRFHEEMDREFEEEQRSFEAGAAYHAKLVEEDNS